MESQEEKKESSQSEREDKNQRKGEVGDDEMGESRKIGRDSEMENKQKEKEETTNTNKENLAHSHSKEGHPLETVDLKEEAQLNEDRPLKINEEQPKDQIENKQESPTLEPPLNHSEPSLILQGSSPSISGQKDKALSHQKLKEDGSEAPKIMSLKAEERKVLIRDSEGLGNSLLMELKAMNQSLASESSGFLSYKKRSSQIDVNAAFELIFKQLEDLKESTKQPEQQKIGGILTILNGIQMSLATRERLEAIECELSEVKSTLEQIQNNSNCERGRESHKKRAKNGSSPNLKMLSSKKGKGLEGNEKEEKNIKIINFPTEMSKEEDSSGSNQDEKSISSKEIRERESKAFMDLPKQIEYKKTQERVSDFQSQAKSKALLWKTG